ncbi:MAG: hypothetical protein WC054_04030 [Candidatus Nanopelagicales bacterium]
MTNPEEEAVGDDGLTDEDREASAQRYRDATNLTPEQIQKAKQVLQEVRDGLENDIESDGLAEARMIGSLKGWTGYPNDPDALWAALKYDPSVDPEEIVLLTRILAEMHALDSDTEPHDDWDSTITEDAERFYNYMGIHSVGPGWWRLILDCHKELMGIDHYYEIGQIKQKLGGLKYYINSTVHNEDQRTSMQEIIDRCERRSRFICEQTGHPGVLMEQTGSVATLNPKTAPPEWRVSTLSPLTTQEAIKECPGAIDRLLNDLFHDTAQEVQARTAEHFTRLRGDRNDNTN